ncbi:2-hydroxyacylsphingosine 1-beta-galactosyltransferase [Orchesella cincta]|uniref:2-hydroxyacylsphingosine 1-beta-galactosyltransferase n=1 Tax=Orchesella cincta TaxID=48709 RepID=A0A1D2MAS1_ORCCI|nr:2-hydroxyacylsphingosine 1-beta-galactosyltransferase [Orchesella cincta]
MDALSNDCAYGMAYHFKAKLISFNTAIQYPWDIESHNGFPDETSSIPDGMMHFPTKMNFWQRAVAALVPLVWKVYKENWAFPHLEDMMKNGLGLVEVPKFVDIEANTSLVFINSHWSTEYPRSYPPNGKPLPKNLEDFINKSKNGFIYVSFGTVGEFTKFDPEFIWKSTYPIQEKLPKNVLVEKWLPQKDILVHPKIRMYITHGGVGGIYESILSKVPNDLVSLFSSADRNSRGILINYGAESIMGIQLELNFTERKEEGHGCCCAKIVSHRVPLQPLIDALADRGHNITFLSGFPPKSPNPKVTEFNPPKLTAYMNQFMDFDFDVFKYRKNSEIILTGWLNMPHLAVEISKSLNGSNHLMRIDIQFGTAGEICATGFLSQEHYRSLPQDEHILYPRLEWTHHVTRTNTQKHFWKENGLRINAATCYAKVYGRALVLFPNKQTLTGTIKAMFQRSLPTHYYSRNVRGRRLGMEKEPLPDE